MCDGNFEAVLLQEYFYLVAAAKSLLLLGINLNVTDSQSFGVTNKQ